MAEGFRAAEAYVEVTSKLDEDHVLASARRAAEGIERELTDGGERAGRGLTEALGRAGDDAGSAVVRSAEGRIRDARGRFLAAGSEVGKGVGKGAEDESHRSGFRAFLGLIGHAPKAGKEAAQGLVSALGEGVKGPAGPYLIAGLSAGAVVAGPLVGSVLAGGIMAGIAAAGIGGGIAIQASDPKVKHAFGELGQEIGDILKDSSSPFRDQLLDVADRGSAAFQRWKPMLDQIFGNSAKLMEPFVDMVENVGDRILPTIMTTINAARPAVEALTKGVEGTVDAVSDVIDSLGDNGPEAAAGLTAAFFLVQSSIRSAGLALNLLTEGFGMLIEGGLDVMGFLGEMGEKLAGLPGPLGGIGSQLKGLVPVTEEWRGKWEGLKNQMTGAADAGSEGTDKLSERTKLLSLSMGEAITQAGGLSAAFQALNGGALSAREAESAYQAAIDNVSASIKENGKTLDLHTDKGRKNDAAIRQLITTTDQKAQATYDEVNATKGAEAAQAAASKVYEQGRAQLIKNLTQILGNKEAATKMADSIMKIPKSWNSDIKATDKATPTINAIKSRIASINGRTVVVAVKYETHGSIQGEHIIGQGTKTKYATGGEVMGGSGWRDDVPILAMGGEWVIRKAARQALERQFGPGFMQRLNTWDQGGKGGPTPHIISGHRWKGLASRQLPDPAAAAAPAPAASGGGGGSAPPPIYIGSVTLDASGMSSIQDVVDLIGGITASARAYSAS